MEKLCVPRLLSVSELQGVNKNSSLPEISSRLEHVEHHSLECTPWPQFPYKPKVFFSIAYCDECILLKYHVHEKAIRIVHNRDNHYVHEDSCVEFFIAFNDDTDYYNLEFNCAGTCLFGFGSNSSRRELMKQELIDKIRTYSIIQRLRDDENRINWQLTLVIPLEIFKHSSVKHLRGTQCRVNFYKCGDQLPEPHFVTWNNIDAASPNFHLPEFFGAMHFV
ncbi:MAG TPA: carbohydrate-binding family 9-like protein [Chitinophagaceae bacterium]|nr:carbohydrate-binding family 9-like protein [Chitinophagaceae bacterium]